MEEKEKEKCCVCGLVATKSMQFTGGERVYPIIHYCDKHGEWNDRIGFDKRSFQT